MEVMEVAHKIELLINALRDEGARSKELIEAKGQTTMDYKKARAVQAAKLKSEGVAVTMIKHQAEGSVANLEYDKIVAEEGLKAHWARMDNLKSQMNAYQSINRYLANTG